MKNRLGRHEWLEFTTRSALAEALAQRVAGTLAAAVETRSGASLAVSGGSTPGLFFDALSRCGIGWDKVAITLADERFVPPAGPRSNQRLVEERLLRDAAARARFVPLFHPAGSVDEAAAAADKALATLRLPLDMAVLGMGTDGHTASFFPDAPNLPELLANEAGRLVLPVVAPGAGEPRLTLSMQCLAAARLIALHIEGDAKRDALAQALEAGPGDAPPICALLETADVPVHIFWAP